MSETLEFRQKLCQEWCKPTWYSESGSPDQGRAMVAYGGFVSLRAGRDWLVLHDVYRITYGERAGQLHYEPVRTENLVRVNLKGQPHHE